MAGIDHHGLLMQLLPALLEAGRIEMAYFRDGVAVRHKADRSPVTAADHDAEACLLAALGRIAPGVPVVAEEQVAAGRVPALADMFFLVDPLDGTREFVAGRPEFSINVGLVVDGRPVFGVVYGPASGALYATLGQGRAAWATVAPDDAAAASGVLDWSPLTGRAADPENLVAVESRSHRTPEADRLLAERNVRSALKLGSALKFGVLARGGADLYLRLGATGEWDTAAGHAVVEAAGGSVTDLEGRPLTYGHGERRFINPPFIAWGRKE